MSIDLEKLRFPIGKFKIEPVKEEDYSIMIDLSAIDSVSPPNRYSNG